jgi:hypothetical protein
VANCKLAGRWFRQHRPATAGDPHAMLTALHDLRPLEREGGSDALLEAGLALADGGRCLQLQRTYYPPNDM